MKVKQYFPKIKEYIISSPAQQWEKIKEELNEVRAELEKKVFEFEKDKYIEELLDTVQAIYTYNYILKTCCYETFKICSKSYEREEIVDRIYYYSKQDLNADSLHTLIEMQNLSQEILYLVFISSNRDKKEFKCNLLKHYEKIISRDIEICEI